MFFKNAFLAIFPLSLLSFSAVAGNDVAPPPIDQVLVNCTLHPVDDRWPDPGSPRGTRFGMFFKDWYPVFGEPYKASIEQKFALIYNGQSPMWNKVAPGVYAYETANRWRIMGHSSIANNQLCVASAWNGSQPTAGLNVRWCDSAGHEGERFHDRVFHFTASQYPYVGATRVRVAEERLVFMAVNLMSDDHIPAFMVKEQDISDYPMSTRDFQLLNCRNREHESVSPMKYNR